MIASPYIYRLLDTPGKNGTAFTAFTLSRGVLARREIPPRAVIFRCVDAHLCAVKENEVDERGKVRNRIPRRIDDEKAVSHLHDSDISNIGLIVIVIFLPKNNLRSYRN